MPENKAYFIAKLTSKKASKKDAFKRNAPFFVY